MRHLVGGLYTEFREFSPDGRYLAFGQSRGPETFFHPLGVFVRPVDGGNTIDVTATIDRYLESVVWLPGGKSILVGGSGEQADQGCSKSSNNYFLQYFSPLGNTFCQAGLALPESGQKQTVLLLYPVVLIHSILIQ